MRPVERVRRHSRLRFYEGQNGRLVAKQYAVRAQFEREVAGYARLRGVTDRVEGAECPDIVDVDHVAKTLRMEYVSGYGFQDVLGATESEDWEDAWTVVKKVLLYATRDKLAFDCDPTNILVSDGAETRIVFIDPECIENRPEPFSASVFFVGCFRVLVKRLTEPRQALVALKRWRRMMTDFLSASQVTEGELRSGMSQYALVSARSNMVRGPNEGAFMGVIRMILYVPFWLMAAAVFRVSRSR